MKEKVTVNNLDMDRYIELIEKEKELNLIIKKDREEINKIENFANFLLSYGKIKFIGYANSYGTEINSESLAEIVSKGSCTIIDTRYSEIDKTHYFMFDLPE